MKTVDGENILYHYIQKKILALEDEFSKKLVEKLLIDLSIWLPTEIYKQLPIILPYAVRDPSCRKKGTNGIDEWGCSNSKGFLKDDNSLIKGIVSSFIIKSPNIDEYNNARRAKGFVASHIWREIYIDSNSQLASTHHKTYSFIPNLVWLPKQISKLTDREKSYAQQILQTISHRIYNSSVINQHGVIKDIWNSLPNPNIPLEIDLTKLNFFEPPEGWILKRKKQLLEEITLIQRQLNDQLIRDVKIKCSKYSPSLKKICPEHKQAFLQWLNSYKENILKF